MKKFALVAAAAAGYVLGTRAGRERYEQIKARATQLWENPRVQKTVNDAEDMVKNNAGDVGGKAAQTASHAASAVVDKAKSVTQHDDKAADEPSGGHAAPPTPPTPPTPPPSHGGPSATSLP